MKKRVENDEIDNGRSGGETEIAVAVVPKKGSSSNVIPELE